MPNATPIRPHPHTGKLTSIHSKSGNSKCSQAASEWRRRKATPDTYKTLAKCRAEARGATAARLKQASGKLAEGRGTKVREEKAATLRAAHAEKAGKARPAAVARSVAIPPIESAPAPAPDSGGFSLKRDPASGRKASAGFVDAGKGRTGTLFDMKRGDKPGQTSLLEQVPSVETHPTPAAVTSDQPPRGKPKAASRSDPQREALAAKLRAFRDLSPSEKASWTAAAVRRHEDRMAERLKTPQAVQSVIDGFHRSVANGLPYDVSGHVATLERVKKRLADASVASDRPSDPAPVAPPISPAKSLGPSSSLPGGTKPAMTPEQIAKAVAEHRASKPVAANPPIAPSPASPAAPSPKAPRTDRLARLAGRLVRHRETLGRKVADRGNRLFNRNIEVLGRGRQLDATGRAIGEELRASIMGQGASKPSIPPRPADLPTDRPGAASAPPTPTRPAVDHAKIDRFQSEIRALRQSPDPAGLADLHSRMSREVNGWESEVLANRTLGRKATAGMGRDARLDAIRGHLAAGLPEGSAGESDRAKAEATKAREAWQDEQKRRLVADMDRKAAGAFEPFRPAVVARPAATATVPTPIPPAARPSNPGPLSRNRHLPPAERVAAAKEHYRRAREAAAAKASTGHKAFDDWFNSPKRSADIARAAAQGMPLD